VTWRCYRVALRLVSPMHIGWRVLGNVKVTRPYLPGRALWGGLTARLTRDYPKLGDYEAVGQSVQSELAFSYFYPSVSTEKVTHWPFSGAWSESSSRFLGSYASTALADGRSKEDGSLHETEYLSPMVEGSKQVYLLGYVLEREGSALPWRHVLAHAQFGGERGYGWGRVAACTPTQSQGMFDLTLSLDGARPVVHWQAGHAALAHVRAIEGRQVDGSIEPLSGRITNPRRGVPGVEHAPVDVTWAPGSLLREEGELACRIEENGIWALPDLKPTVEP
jgi:hypothetical protein